MTAPDEFGRDPGVRMMRRVFERLEKVQASLIAQAGLSPFDERLRGIRETALAVFERAWADRAGRRASLTENDYAGVYEASFREVLNGKDFDP